MQKIWYWGKRVGIFVILAFVISGVSSAIVASLMPLISEDTIKTYFDADKEEFIECCGGIFYLAFTITYLCKAKIASKFYFVGVYLLLSIVLLLITMITMI